MTPFRREIFKRLAPEGGLTRVVSRDGKIDKVIITDPWTVANPDLIQWGWVLVTIALILQMVSFAFFRPYLALCSGIGLNLIVLAMIMRTIAPKMSGFERWNDYLVLGDYEEIVNDVADDYHLPVLEHHG